MAETIAVFSGGDSDAGLRRRRHFLRGGLGSQHFHAFTGLGAKLRRGGLAAFLNDGCFGGCRLVHGALLCGSMCTWLERHCGPRARRLRGLHRLLQRHGRRREVRQLRFCHWFLDRYQQWLANDEALLMLQAVHLLQLGERHSVLCRDALGFLAGP